MTTTPTRTNLVPLQTRNSGGKTAAPTARTVDERIALGKELRKLTPLDAHAEYTSAPNRIDPLTILEEQSAQRLAELIPLRYGRMSESPFRFYRGAAALMAADLSTSPSSGLRAQLCGDAHLLNFRLLASPERQLIFDINDFDETLPGPWEWDLKRLTASIVIAARANGFGPKVRRDLVMATVRSYREWMHHFASTRTLDLWYMQANMDAVQKIVAPQLAKRGRRQLSAAMAAARRRDNAQALKRLTHRAEDGSRRIASDPPLVVTLDDLLPTVERAELEAWLARLVHRYSRTLSTDRRQLVEQYRVVDMARKVVGVGSVGTRCWIVLLLGRDENDPLLLQVKEAGESVLASYTGPSQYSNSGQRVVAGQRLMQAASDIFLGWERTEGIDGRTRDFYVRQLRDWKGIAAPERMKPQGMRWFGIVCGATLARAHAKSGDRIAIAAYVGSRDTFDRALAVFAESYADQNERDHQRLLEAISAGEVRAQTDPKASR